MTIFKIIYWLGIFIEMGIRAPLQKTWKTAPKTDQRISRTERVMLGLLALVMFVIPVRFRLWGLAKFMLISNLALGCLGMVHALPDWLSGGGAPVAYLAHFGGAIAGWYYARSLGYGGLPRNLTTLGSTFHPGRRPAMAGKMTRRRVPKVELDEEAIHRENPRKDPVVDLMRHEVDPILDKINDFGFNSLTDEEKRTLERASRQMTKNGKV